MENNIYGRQLALTERKGGRDRLPHPGVGGHTRQLLGAGLSLAQDPLISGKDLEREGEFSESWPSLRGWGDDAHARPESQVSAHPCGILSRGWGSPRVVPPWKSCAETRSSGSPAGPSHCLSFAKFIPQTPLELPLGSRWFPSVPRFIPDRLHTIY